MNTSLTLPVHLLLCFFGCLLIIAVFVLLRCVVNVFNTFPFSSQFPNVHCNRLSRKRYAVCGCGRSALLSWVLSTSRECVGCVGWRLMSSKNKTVPANGWRSRVIFRSLLQLLARKGISLKPTTRLPFVQPLSLLPRWWPPQEFLKIFNEREKAEGGGGRGVGSAEASTVCAPPVCQGHRLAHNLGWRLKWGFNCQNIFRCTATAIDVLSRNETPHNPIWAANDLQTHSLHWQVSCARETCVFVQGSCKGLFLSGFSSLESVKVCVQSLWAKETGQSSRCCSCNNNSWLLYMWQVSYSYLTWLNRMWDMTYSVVVWARGTHCSFSRNSWLLHTWHDSFISKITRSNVRHDIFMCYVGSTQAIGEGWTWTLEFRRFVPHECQCKIFQQTVFWYQ